MCLKYDCKIETRIVELFINSDLPLNTAEVAKQANTQRITAKKHLARLADKGLIEEIDKPPMRLFRVKDTKESLREYLRYNQKNGGQTSDIP